MIKSLLALLGAGAIYYYYKKGKIDESLVNPGIALAMPNFNSASPSTQYPYSVPQGRRADILPNLSSEPWYSGPRTDTNVQSLGGFLGESFEGLSMAWQDLSDQVVVVRPGDQV